MDPLTHDLFLCATPDAVALCTRSRSTWWRWLHGKASAPLSVISLLRIVVRGEIPHGGQNWSGWVFRRGKLCDPSGYEHTPASIQAWHYIAQQLQAIRAKENARAAALPTNATQHPSARPAHALTDELYRRLEGER